MRSDDVIKAFEQALSGDRNRFINTIKIIQSTEGAAGKKDVAKRLSYLVGRFESPRGQLVELPHLWPGFAAITPAKTLDGLLLSDELAASLRGVKVERDRAEALMANNLRPRNRLLFHGPPGNGKTAAAEALANLLEVPFLFVNHHSLIDSHLGETARNLATAMRSAGSQECVLFIDEADAVAASRSSDNAAACREIDRVVNSLLMELDTLPQCVTFVAATNRMDVLDPAFVRRFDSVLEFKAPTEQHVAQFVAFLKSRHPVLAGQPVDLVSLRGMSFAEIETRLRNVARELIVAA